MVLGVFVCRVSVSKACWVIEIAGGSVFSYGMSYSCGTVGSGMGRVEEVVCFVLFCVVDGMLCCVCSWLGVCGTLGTSCRAMITFGVCCGSANWYTAHTVVASNMAVQTIRARRFCCRAKPCRLSAACCCCRRSAPYCCNMSSKLSCLTV